MDQHLVDHYLKEQRRHQREQLQEQRGHQHLVEQFSVFQNGRDEPTEIKAAAAARKPRTFGGENDPAAPLRLECLRIEHTDL